MILGTHKDDPEQDLRDVETLKRQHYTSNVLHTLADRQHKYRLLTKLKYEFDRFARLVPSKMGTVRKVAVTNGWFPWNTQASKYVEELPGQPTIRCRVKSLRFDSNFVKKDSELPYLPLVVITNGNASICITASRSWVDDALLNAASVRLGLSSWLGFRGWRNYTTKEYYPEGSAVRDSAMPAVIKRN